MRFIPSLELSRMLYEEEIAPIMEEKFHDLEYAAATLGMCSEILGLDDQISMDHEWGPRVILFLSEQDHARYSTDMMPVFQELLPTQFKGFDMMWRRPGVDVHDTREAILYHVSVGTVPNTLNFYGGITALPLQELDWLRVSEQHLLEFTSGTVYRDDTGELTRARELLKYYPDNVLRFLLMHEWYTVNGDWFPIGRIGSRGVRLAPFFGPRIGQNKVNAYGPGQGLIRHGALLPASDSPGSGADVHGCRNGSRHAAPFPGPGQKHSPRDRYSHT